MKQRLLTNVDELRWKKAMGSALTSTFACAAPGSGPWGAYLRIVGAPPGTPTDTPPKVGALGEGPEIVWFRQVGTAFVVPTDGQLYVPTDGAVTVPYPAVPAAWASAAVLECAMAAASTTVANFMAVSFLVVFRERCGEGIDRLQRTQTQTWSRNSTRSKVGTQFQPPRPNCVMFGAGGFGYFLTDAKYCSTSLSAGPDVQPNSPPTTRSSCGSISML
jgi:hypothetical protein